MVNYQLVRSPRRKTLGLQVKCGRVIVRAPFTLSEEYISLFIKEKTVWLKAKIAEQRSKPQSCHFNQGSTLLYFGKLAKINISLVKRPNVFLTKQLLHSADEQYKEPVAYILNVDVNQKIYSHFSDSNQQLCYIQKQLSKFFKHQAQPLISQRLSVISNKITLTPKKVTVKQYRARWGSCNNRGEVSFNYLLIMTPLFVIDYVIVHELCHLVHLNHSPNFWQLVAHHFPEYKTAKEWLKNNQSQLYWQVD